MEKITTAASASAAWRSMSDEEQYTALQKMAWTVRRGSSKRGAEWIQTQDDAMTVAAEAWLRMGTALERNERADEPRPLKLILYSACAQAANTIARREKHYSSAVVSLNTEDGEMTDLFDTNAVHVLPAPAPEENAVRRVLPARLLQTDEDRGIAGRMAEGLTVREIAAALGMSRSAVQRRINNIRNRARLLASADVVTVLGISRAGAYKLAHSADFPAFQIGKRIVVSREKFLEWLDRQCEEQKCA